MKNLNSIYKRSLVFVFILTSCVLFSCQKLLEEKHLKTLVVPETLDDLQALLDMHNNMVLSNPEIAELIADNYYTTSAYWNALNDEDRLNHVWDAKITSLKTWTGTYQNSIYYANVVLDVLPTLEVASSDRNKASEIKGMALFHRALTFQQLAQLYCRPYSESAKTDLGIPLRLTAAIEVKSRRSTVQETYDQIIGDLNLALELLPDQSLLPTRPTKAAVLGLLARTYLSMRDYENAGIYADLCLKIHPELMDYNDITDVAKPFKRFNSETIFYKNGRVQFSILLSPRAIIDPKLYDSYDPNDLRKKLFFKEYPGDRKGTYQFNGNYDSESNPNYVFMGGIATDEIYLIRAESYARAGKTDPALQDLNKLMVNRWKKENWQPFTANTSEEALKLILDERRKELLFRGLRWSDLRRLNLEGANITLKRELDGVGYTLPPNDLRWVLLFPDEVINRSNMEQNPRD